MKYYNLKAVVNGKAITVNKKFSTRNSAIDAFFKMVAVKAMNTQVEEIIERGDKHNLEYICNNNSRFLVSRVLVA